MYGIYYFIGKHLPQKAVAAAYRIGADMTAFYFIHWLFVAGIVYLGLYICYTATAHKKLHCLHTHLKSEDSLDMLYDILFIVIFILTVIVL